MRLAHAWRRERNGTREVQIVVRGGYHPATIHAHVGEPLRLRFRREETASCSERVVFPDFGKSAMLPAFEEVALELTPQAAGSYDFTCEFGMLRGRLLVDDLPERSRR